MRKMIAAFVGLIILAGVNYTIYSREQLLSNGQIVLLELAPVDPRSLMQGDYMALDFAINRTAFVAVATEQAESLKDGYLVVSLDKNRVAQFQRFANNTPVSGDERLLRYRVRDGQPKFATNAYFFQEGTSEQYVSARYGEFRVSDSGDMILTKLRDAQFAELGLPRDDNHRDRGD